MTFPISYLFFFFTLISGTTLSISSTSWFGAWLGLELNLLSFIPLITTKLCPYLSEAAIKYFLIQALASTVLIMSASVFLYAQSVSHIMILLSLLLKLGAAPFHFWFPQVTEGLSWPQAFVLLTIQKLAPMFLISYLTFSNMLMSIIMISALTSSLAGAIGGLNIMKLRKLMAFSSINHMSWMLVGIYMGDMYWLTYFSLYSFVSGSVVVLLYTSQSLTMSNLLNQSKKNLMMNMFIPMNILSLGGLPPFLGFIPKWIMIQYMACNSMFFPLLILLVSSLITLYFYLRLFVPMTLLSFSYFTSNVKLKSLFSSSFPLLSMSFINMFGILFPIPFMI
uniref:NADH-ubiquinone oxidoreductase chain 2 n=1 Tax=Portunus sanguinolentus TaxID=411673 RepID=A0A0P0DJ21_9EUCA|nr:NADH dehydrogenase subunit 2 [Portunus sanguinolentus]ALJ11004.1 NADH dehydrogenase subunit 2 [Portunus sanguinolentus]ALK60827.1 NADH dehydrogenase subunit 2 [Portunus sanguinolentus]